MNDLIEDIRSAKIQLFRLLKQKNKLTENEHDLTTLLEVDRDIVKALNNGVLSYLRDENEGQYSKRR